MATSRSLSLTVSFGFLMVRCAFNRGSAKPIPRTGGTQHLEFDVRC
jgi:hypothetical protein